MAYLPGGDRPRERLAEFHARQAAALNWIHTAFDRAEAAEAAGVLLLMHAEPTATRGYAALRNEIARRAGAFRRPVLLVHGDEHHQEVERAYAGVRNLTRLETFGETTAQWLRVTVDPAPPRRLCLDRTNRLPPAATMLTGDPPRRNRGCSCASR